MLPLASEEASYLIVAMQIDQDHLYFRTRNKTYPQNVASSDDHIAELTARSRNAFTVTSLMDASAAILENLSLSIAICWASFPAKSGGAARLGTCSPKVK